MTATDFIRDGKVGDKVHDVRIGNGVIIYIKPSNKYSIICSFNGEQISYTHKGKLYPNDKIAILCWGHRETLDQGKPPERVKYPLYMKHAESSLVVKFTGLKAGTVVIEAEMSNGVGISYEDYSPHTNRKVWIPCKRPAWKSDKPTWCYVGGRVSRLIYKVNTKGEYVDVHDYGWSKAKPCATKDIPNWWPKEWV